MYYPLFIDVSQCACLIIGGGEVGFRKAQSLLKAKASSVLILDIHDFNDYWDAVRNNPHLHLEKRPFTAQDLQGKSLVFACTGDRGLNATIAELCAAQNILCNCVDAPHKGTCIVPALAAIQGKNEHDSSLMAAISTEGASPAWSRQLRMELEEWLIPHAPMTVFLGRLRPHVLELGQPTAHNTALFRALVQSPLRTYLAQGKKELSQQLLEELLPPSLHKYIMELLNDII